MEMIFFFNLMRKSRKLFDENKETEKNRATL